MPPRFAYWTILVEGKPTSFRARHREDLLPTLRQLQGKHPDAVMMWFARGKLWNSPEDARAAQRRGGGTQRDRDWRPGGAHRDPRKRFEIPRDEKRRRFAARLRRPRREDKPPEGEDRDAKPREVHKPRWQRDRRDVRRGPKGGGRRGGGGPRGGGRGGESR